MMKFIRLDNHLLTTVDSNAENSIDEKTAFAYFAEHLRVLRTHCNLTLVQLAEQVDIPNQTLSSYENKTHMPSMMQALKIASFFHLTIEEFILCGFDGYPYDITELYEQRKHLQ